MSQQRERAIQSLENTKRDAFKWLTSDERLRDEFRAGYLRAREMFAETHQLRREQEQRVHQLCRGLMRERRLYDRRIDLTRRKSNSDLLQTVPGLPILPCSFPGFCPEELLAEVNKVNPLYVRPTLQRKAVPWVRKAIDHAERAAAVRAMAHGPARELAEENLHQERKSQFDSGLAEHVWHVVLVKPDWHREIKAPSQLEPDEVTELSDPDRLAYALWRLGGLVDLWSMDPIRESIEEFDLDDFMTDMFRDVEGRDPSNRERPDPEELDPDHAEQMLAFAKRSIKAGLSLCGGSAAQTDGLKLASKQRLSVAKPDGWTRAELIAQANHDDEEGQATLTPTTFDRIREAAKIASAERGGRGQQRRFSVVDLRKLIFAAEAINSQKRCRIASAWRELLPQRPDS